MRGLAVDLQASIDSGTAAVHVPLRARDLSATSEKLRHRQRPKSCITFALTLIGSRRSAVNPTIDQLPHRAVLIFSNISMSFGPVSV